jgi:hypothetical protein
LQSEYSKLSNEYAKLAYEAEKAVSKADSLNLFNKIGKLAGPLNTLLDMASYKHEVDETVAQYQKAYPNLDIIKPDYFGYVQHVISGMSYGLLEVNSTSYDPYDPMPKSSSQAIEWLKAMEAFDSQFKGKYPQEWLDGKTGKQLPPGGFFQYLKIKSEVMQDIVGVSNLRWLDSWHLVYDEKMHSWTNGVPIHDEPKNNLGEIQWATVTMQNQLSAITNGGTSHFGSASLYMAYNNQQPNANVNPTNTNNYQTQTGAQQTAYSTNSQAFQSSDWVMVTGNAATHTGVGNSFGPITAPDGGQIASLNNAGVQYTVMTKDFFVPTGTKQVTLTFNGNFVTNEYPVFVGSQYNDYATVKITSPSGNVTPVTAFNQSLNASNFTTVNGLPSPLGSTGGQTGFKASTATINVAGGGKVTVEVKVANVGDTAVPSAVLLNKITVK